MERNKVFDIMKGITIILVIVGHISWLPEEAKKVIFSFHMPLFFILSGYFHKQSPFKKDIIRLICPYLATGLLLLLYNQISRIPAFDFGLFEEDVLKIIWGSGSRHMSPIGGRISAIGAIWFLLALFWCKRFYSVLVKRINNRITLGIVCIVISLMAILIDHKVLNFPFAILPGLAAIVFYYVGDCMKTVKKLPVSVAVVISAFWVISIIKLPILALVICKYNLYPISVLGACGGTYCIYCLSKLISKTGFLSNAFSLIGRITLPILCFHLFQINTHFLIPNDSHVVAVTSMILFPILISLLLSRFIICRKAFGIPEIAIT